MNDERHADDCDCLLGMPENDGWVEDAFWNDADVCTCHLKDVMARRAIYGDERLVSDLPFDALKG